MMRIALCSDIHGNISGLKAILEQLKCLGGADLFFVAGDTLGIGPGHEDVIDILIQNKACILRGNHEELDLDVDTYLNRIPEQWKLLTRKTNIWLHKNLSKPYWDLMAALPLYQLVDVAPGHRLMVCHATPASTWERVCAADAPTDALEQAFGSIDADVIAYGHYHHHHTLWLGNKLLINVASVGARADGLSAMSMIEFRDQRWNVCQFLVPYDRYEEKRLMKLRHVPGVANLI
jgi:predicted phosphodiesterase